MILKKIQVDGQDIHVQLSKEDARKAYLNQEPLVFTDEAEKTEFMASFEAQKEEPKHEEPKSRNKLHKLVQMLPFMDEETIHELVQKILADEQGLLGIDIAVMLPFLEEEDIKALFKKAMQGGHPKLNPMVIAPFVDEDDLSFVVDEYIAGNLSESQLDALYPFLNEDDLKRLFKHIINEA
ncbi:MAG: hypothetical protein RBS87_02785 [Acholeplasma sp.]|jgi:hypothetical protein|nr:hypothetical protein [Acholeplasma sp.]